MAEDRSGDGTEVDAELLLRPGDLSAPAVLSCGPFLSSCGSPQGTCRNGRQFTGHHSALSFGDGGARPPS